MRGASFHSHGMKRLTMPAHMMGFLGQLKLMVTHGVQQKKMKMENMIMENTSQGIGDAAAKHALWKRVAIAFFLSHIKELLTVLVQCMTQ